MSDENARVLAHAEMQGARTKRPIACPGLTRSSRGSGVRGKNDNFHSRGKTRSERLNGCAWRHHRRACASA